MPSRRTTLEETVEWITRRIESGEWPLHSRIPSQDDLVEAIDVGHTVLRQALKVLATNGMLESARGRGTFVRARNALNTVLTDHLGHQPVPHTLGLRRAVEVEAAGLAAANRTDGHVAILRSTLITPQPRCWTATFRPATGRTDVSPDMFHTTVFTASRNPLLAEVHLAAVSALRYARLAPASADQRNADHRRILAAIEDGDVPAARAAAAAHADRGTPLCDD